MTVRDMDWVPVQPFALAKVTVPVYVPAARPAGMLIPGMLPPVDMNVYAVEACADMVEFHTMLYEVGLLVHAVYGIVVVCAPLL